MATTRTYLNVPFSRKDEAKAAGARWDAGARKWYVEGAVPAALASFVPGSVAEHERRAASGSDLSRTMAAYGQPRPYYKPCQAPTRAQQDAAAARVIAAETGQTFDEVMAEFAERDAEMEADASKPLTAEEEAMLRDDLAAIRNEGRGYR